jgi:hypothetical protein
MMEDRSRTMHSATPSSRRRSFTARLRARRASGGERGSVLVLSLVYIISISLIVGALSDWAMNDLNNTAHFQSTSELDYAVTSATQVAIQSIRYTPLYSQTKNPLLGECWTPASGHYLSQLTGFNGFNVSVWCSTVQNLASPETRIVSFYSCTSPTTAPVNSAQALADGEACYAQPLLYAQVAFDDYLPGSTTLSTTCAGIGYCGFGATELEWSWSGASASVGQAVNATTITSTAPGSATVGGATYTPTATATSGDTVAITSGTASVCTVSGGVVSMVGTGLCTLDFNDNGNLNYAPAIQVTQSFTVSASVGTTTTTTATTTTTTSSAYSGSTNGNSIPTGNNYYLINGNTGASSSSTGNAYTPGVATTLKKLTFTIDSSSGSSHTATVDVISGGTASATALSCTITGGSNQTSCSVTVSVSVTSTNSINIDATGNGNHAGTWTVTYTQP